LHTNPSIYGYDVTFPGFGNITGRVVWERNCGLLFEIPEGEAQQLLDVLKRTGVVVPLIHAPVGHVPITSVSAPEQAAVASQPVATSIQQTVTSSFIPSTEPEEPAPATFSTPSLENPTVAVSTATANPDMAIIAMEWIPARTRNSLANANLHTAHAVFSKSNADLLKVKGVGQGFFDSCAREIAEIRAKLGIQVPDAVSVAPPVANPVPVPTQATVQAPTTDVRHEVKTGSLHEGIAIVKLEKFADNQGHLITRQDGMRVRFDANYNEMARVSGDPIAAAKGMPPMTGLAGATSSTPLPTTTTTTTTTQQPIASQGEVLPGVAQKVYTQPSTPANVASTGSPDAYPGLNRGSVPEHVINAVMGSHTAAKAIQALSSSLRPEQIVAFLRANAECLPFKGTMNPATLDQMVPAVLSIMGPSA
jgi:hypothetical protein